MRHSDDVQAKNRSKVQRSLASFAGTEFRPDVEGLRAVAVVAVVLFHAKIRAFSGGFVGVDVFFVLSGFLITRQLLRELQTDGTLSLPTFWARRARRLLPASGLVIVVTMIMSQWLLSPLAIQDLAVDALGAGVFSVNFVFANRLGDYFGAQSGETTPSPLLHFWSLAVEEQFYLFWPALMLALSRRPRHYLRLVLSAIVILGVASFGASIWLTNHRPSWAFYLLPARIGELLVGALLAVSGTYLTLAPARLRAVAAWLGVAGILVAFVSYDGSVSFPGTATILPVFSTALILTAGGHSLVERGPAAMLSWQPLQWIGRHSYAIYLWHWPVLVLTDSQFGPLSLLQRSAAIAFSVGLAAISLQFVEDPVRHSRWLAAFPRRGLLLGAALCATALIAGLAALSLAPELRTNTVAAAPVLVGVAAEPSTTSNVALTTIPGVGAMSATTTVSVLPVVTEPLTLVASNQLVLAQGLAASDVPANLRPSLGQVGGDKPKLYDDGCVAEGRDDRLKDCRYGIVDSSIRVVLYGDSHAAQWFLPLEQIAMTQGFELIVMTKGGCPTAEVYMPTATLRRTCPIWRDQAIQMIGQLHPDMVIVAAASSYPNPDDEWATGFDLTMARLAPLTSRLVVLGDNPSSATKSGPAACLSDHLRDVQSCATTRDEAIDVGHLAAEQGVAARYDATFIDTSDWLCTAAGCPAIIGDIQLYRDNTHLTTVGSEWFRPLIEEAVMARLSR